MKTTPIIACACFILFLFGCKHPSVHPQDKEETATLREMPTGGDHRECLEILEDVERSGRKALNIDLRILFLPRRTYCVFHVYGITEKEQQKIVIQIVERVRHKYSTKAIQIDFYEKEIETNRDHEKLLERVQI